MKTSAYFITHFALFTCHSPIPSPVIAVPGSFPYHTTMTETNITGIAINSFTTSTWRGGGKISANQALSHGEEAETSLGMRLCPNSTWFTRAFLLVRGWGLGTRLIVHRPPQWFYGTQLIHKQQRWADM